MTDPTMIRVTGYDPVTVDTQPVGLETAATIDLTVTGPEGEAATVELSPLEALAVAEALTRHARHSLAAERDSGAGE